MPIRRLDRRHLLPGLLAGSLAAQAPVTIEGRVVDGRGAGIPAAAIEGRGAKVQRTIADGDGVFMLRLPEKPRDLTCMATGFATVTRPWRGPLDGPVVVFQLRPGAAVAGRITDSSGQAVANAHVVAIVGDSSASTTSDSRGNYALSGLPLGRGYALAFAGEERGGRQLWFGQETGVDLALDRRHVRAELEVTGLPADLAASVQVLGRDPALLFQRGQLQLGPDRRALVPTGASSMATARLSAHGYQGEPKDTIVTGGCNQQWRAVPSAIAVPTVLRGRFLDDTMRPFPGLPIYFRDRSGVDLGQTATNALGELRLPIALPAGQFVRAGIRCRNGFPVVDERTRRDGCTWFAFGPEGTVELVVENPGRVRATLRTVDGSPLAFAQVTAATPDEPAEVAAATWTDRNGGFELGVPVGQVDLLATTLDGRVFVGTCAARVDASAAPVWREKPCGSIVGRVLDKRGWPVPGVKVLAACVQLQLPDSRAAASQQMVTAITDELGGFQCRGLPAGSWTIAVSCPIGETNALVQIDAGTQMTQDLQF